MCLAVPGKIESITDEAPPVRVGKVNFAGVRKEVSLVYVPEAQVGDYVIVHVGFAISILDEDEAQKVFEQLKQLDELEELDEQQARVQND